jgi:hypothetical protein
MAVDRVGVKEALGKPAIARTIEPEPDLAGELAGRHTLFRALYRDLASRFGATT